MSYIIRTVLICNPCEDNVPLLVHLNVPNAVLAPFTQKDSNLLACLSSRDCHADVVCRWLDSEKACEPVLFDLDIAYWPGARLMPSGLGYLGGRIRLTHGVEIH